jgi:glutathione S-transferase
MRLHNNVMSGNSYKIRLLLRQLERPYQNVAVDIFKGESRTPGFLRLNPAGQTPVLELDDGTMLPESPLGKSHAIVREASSRVMEAKSMADAETWMSVS